MDEDNFGLARTYHVPHTKSPLQWEVKWVQGYPFPEHYDEVMSGDAFWNTCIVEVLDRKKYFDLGMYAYIDPDHPRCYGCGRFIKKGNWWKSEGLTGPCYLCYEDTRWL